MQKTYDESYPDVDMDSWNCYDCESTYGKCSTWDVALCNSIRRIRYSTMSRPCCNSSPNAQLGRNANNKTHSDLLAQDGRLLLASQCSPELVQFDETKPH